MSGQAARLAEPEEKRTRLRLRRVCGHINGAAGAVAYVEGHGTAVAAAAAHHIGTSRDRARQRKSLATAMAAVQEETAREVVVTPSQPQKLQSLVEQTVGATLQVQSLVEQTVGATLQELARGSASPQEAGKVVQAVTRRILEEVAMGSAKSGRDRVREELIADPPPPLLDDLSALPWVLWREGSTPPTTQQQGKEGPLSLTSGEMVCHGGLTMVSQSAQHTMMHWQPQGAGSAAAAVPHVVLLVAKRGDPLVMGHLQDMAVWLSQRGVVTVLEPEVLASQPELRSALPEARTFSASDCLEQRIDLVVTIGGDGTLTWATSLFKGAMPPVLSFAAGSLGFLTPFPLDSWFRTLSRLYGEDSRRAQRLVCRMRLQVTVHRRGASNSRISPGEQKVQCLNEILVHRGQLGALCKLDLRVDYDKVTVVQGDGIIIASPTGSTAYSLSAGGSMVHPGVPGMLLTPISPHSLSFRPVVLPESAEVLVTVPLTSRDASSLSVDGKQICMLEIGDWLQISSSPFPVPTLCRATETVDWFASVSGGLKWNERVVQK